jgi:protein involved in polysaccharide export with SLBB domain
VRTENRHASQIPLVVALLLLFGQLAFTYRSVLTRIGDYSYPVDDAFIQLSIARHLTFDGVYGVTKHGFTAASSSIIWPLLLATIDKVTGDHLLTPLVLNVVFAVVLLVVFQRVLASQAFESTVGSRLFWMCMLVVLIPLPTLVLTGMEHVLHALATVWLVTTSARVIAAGDRPSSSQLERVALAAMVTCAARYEGLFVVLIIAGLALARRSFSLAGAVIGGGVAPVLAFGAYSKAHGGLLLPNSVLLKGRSLAFRDMTDVGDFLFGDLVHRLSTNPHMLVLGGATLLLWLCAWQRDGVWSSRCCALAIAALTTLAHLQMAGLGWFFRYEGYLVALDIVVVALTLTAWFPSPWATLARMKPRPLAVAVASLAAVVVLGPLLKRALEATMWTVTACVNIYEQQVQSARFLARYFPNDTVAVNDIGAVSYYGEHPIVDLMGIATMEVARAKSFRLLEQLSQADIARMTRSAAVAIVYDEWLESIPTSWLGVGKWKIDHNQVCAFPAVTIYAASPDSVPRVIEALRAFSKQLPAGVHQAGRYTQLEARDELYRLDAGDVLHVRVDGAPDIGGALRVRADGSLEFPKIGTVSVRGLSLDEATERTRQHMATAQDAESTQPIGAVALRLLQERNALTYAVGNVLQSGEFSTTTAPTADFLVRVSGADVVAAREAFILRERGDTFRRVPIDVARAEGLLERGDILVVR